ncbi:bifunctional phosphoribosylaminoimidazolecarboxamide formyltransferase/IMP cyclohydrolase [Burkholderiales bacterium]|nr:bifunctional phosphoribosylaminoimidazolecarboxamide formyltransferase/IMP cyclohydrolase [Burkholderiales bacterium]
MSSSKQVLISVSDKTGVIEFARSLEKIGYKILSTGGTAKALSEADIAVTEIGDYTGFPEMLDGRVKTLHPKVHAGILARRNLSQHAASLKEHDIPTIELVVVNLYPFASTVAMPNCTLENAIENIDIGGPSMVRGAAKNWEHVGVITSPEDYHTVLSELTSSATGSLSRETRFALCRKAFSHTAAYDSNVSNYLSAIDIRGKQTKFPQQINLNFRKGEDLRYGENPHQQAAFYQDLTVLPGAIANYNQIQGKELSYNNIADSDAAWECVKSFSDPACVIVKHANPCGVAIGENALKAYQKAFSTDPTSAFGGIIAFNIAVDEHAACAIGNQFVEVVIAPSFSDEAKTYFSEKKNVRLLQIDLDRIVNEFDYKRVGGGVLVQNSDTKNVLEEDLKIVTEIRPSIKQMTDLIFAWRVAKFVKSNAIVFCGNGMTLGVGAGQMSRVDSARIACIKAENANLNLSNSVVASDAFFPFRDGLDVLKTAGANAVIQPGGSVRDDEVIAAANEQGIAMVLTGTRHFRH